jgi:hypothetical protein
MKTKGDNVVIPVEDYAKVCARPEAKDFFEAEPYRRALEGVFNETIKAIETLPGQNIVVFVHDNGDDFDKLRSYYEAYKFVNPRHALSMGGDRERLRQAQADRVKPFDRSATRKLFQPACSSFSEKRCSLA